MFLFPYDYSPDDTKSYDQLIIKIAISEKRGVANLFGWFKLHVWMWLVDLKNNFECDWLS